ncbi:Ger(x)C family spore germination protein [Paenibacillus albicereus]|uniref:Ger(X)C family spore germination protein n=1 Tax=Paenibacillus albicereus TaxID=2726185 RepID=A0A6H2GVV4_9BACL|nr:Ger(x)C family spore germination protein [Paenibacillus albicereus]QJC51537.1 Ger(x)C family spore germination protein [Paenibacillus albicereus]
MRKKHKRIPLQARLPLLLLAALSFCLPISGCWDEIDLTEQGYVSAIGVDYRDGFYEIYAQLMQFASIAKTDSQTKETQVWVGSGRGRSVLGAIADLQRSAQFVLNLEHQKVLLVHERAMPHMEDILDANNRQRASRYTSFVFGTKEPIEELFKSSTFFGHSHLMSTLYNPKAQYEQRSYIRPLSMQEMVRHLHEKGFTALLPSLGMTKADWSNANQRLNVQQYDGLFAFTQKRFMTFMPLSRTSGMRWLDPRFKQFTLEVMKEGKEEETIATVTIDGVHPRYRLVSDGEGSLKYRIELGLKGHVVELNAPIDAAIIEKGVEEQIRLDVEKTYAYGYAQGVDLFLILEDLYRNHLREWQEWQRSGSRLAKPEDVEVKVKFDLVHTGKFDLT